MSVETSLSAHELLDKMLEIEGNFGRIRTLKNAPRILDLDLIAYNDDIIMDGQKLIVPHPRMHERLFVLKPLEDIDKTWVHPKLRLNTMQMIAACDEDQQAKPLEGNL